MDDDTPGTPADLPALMTNLTMPEPIYYDETADIHHARSIDIKMFNAQLMALHAMWGNVRSVKTALSLIKQGVELIKIRREILGLEYGSPQSSNAKKNIYEPLP